MQELGGGAWGEEKGIFSYLENKSKDPSVGQIPSIPQR